MKKSKITLKHADGSRFELEFQGANDSNWANITTDEFMSVDEVATDLFNIWSDHSKQEFAALQESELIGYHFTLGMAIRNAYGFWHPKNPFVVPGDLGDGHPDGMSNQVMVKLHRMLKKAGV
jgi:hypothetical protein